MLLSFISLVRVPQSFAIFDLIVLTIYRNGEIACLTSDLSGTGVFRTCIHVSYK